MEEKKVKFKKTVQVDVDGEKYDVKIVFWDDFSVSTISKNAAAAEWAFKNIVLPAVDVIIKKAISDYFICLL